MDYHGNDQVEGALGGKQETFVLQTAPLSCFPLNHSVIRYFALNFHSL